MKRRELAERILEDLLDNGMINLEYGQENWEFGKQACIDTIKDRLSDYVIVEGRVLE